MKNKDINDNQARFEKVIGYILIVGVVISLVLEIVGVALLYTSSGSLAISRDPAVYIKGQDFFNFVWRHIEKRAQEPAFFLMTLGIIVLILTPFIRVIASVAYFAWHRNLKYVFITLFVLIIVTISLALH